MTFSWSTFWSALVGTTLPALIASIVVLYLTHRTNRAVTLLKGDLDKRATMFSAWHQKRFDALVEIYEAFRAYLDFLRRALYVPSRGQNLDPMWEFRTNIERNLVYLDQETRLEIQAFQGELLLFWNWAHQQHAEAGESGVKAVQYRLDFEVPQYLDKLRLIIDARVNPADA